MQHEVRLSPDGRNVAIRNLREINPRYDGPSEWRASNGGYFTDAQVADWTVLTPRGSTVTITRPPGGMWEVRDVDGTHVCSSPDSAIAADRVVECVRRADGVATVVYDDRDSIEHRRARKLNIDTTKA